MKHRLSCTIFVILLIVGFSPLANAAKSKEWDIYYPKSTLSFEGIQAGVPFKGTFSVYQATVDFDPKRPELASIEVNIDMRSAKTGNADRDENLPKKEWFETAVYPFAQIYGGRIRKLSDTKFELLGMLTLKDKTHDIVMPFTMMPEDDATRVKGEVTINRMDYGVGTGNWANENVIKYPVKITIDLLATERPAIH